MRDLVESTPDRKENDHVEIVSMYTVVFLDIDPNLSLQPSKLSSRWILLLLLRTCCYNVLLRLFSTSS